MKSDTPPIELPKRCDNCGSELTGTEVMCPRCGHCVICEWPVRKAPSGWVTEPVGSPNTPLIALAAVGAIRGPIP
ncbi:MAG: hypothetical protein AMJ54_10880 [Deltaproteobacteria bacterium SG8_13]|nr:MAG: hypothetical protein AMJ54_10880 [Deltaproteobacteria bacterium SG8_13]